LRRPLKETEYKDLNSGLISAVAHSRSSRPCLIVKIRTPVSEIIHSAEGRVLLLFSGAVCVLLFTLESNDRIEEERSGLNKNRCPVAAVDGGMSVRTAYN
jgi:hypothetical protein